MVRARTTIYNTWTDADWNDLAVHANNSIERHWSRSDLQHRRNAYTKNYPNSFKTSKPEVGNRDPNFDKSANANPFPRLSVLGMFDSVSRCELPPGADLVAWAKQEVDAIAEGMCVEGAVGSEAAAIRLNEILPVLYSREFRDKVIGGRIRKKYGIDSNVRRDDFVDRVLESIHGDVVVKLRRDKAMADDPKELLGQFANNAIKSVLDWYYDSLSNVDDKSPESVADPAADPSSTEPEEATGRSLAAVESLLRLCLQEIMYRKFETPIEAAFDTWCVADSMVAHQALEFASDVSSLSPAWFALQRSKIPKTWHPAWSLTSDPPIPARDNSNEEQLKFHTTATRRITDAKVLVYLTVVAVHGQRQRANSGAAKSGTMNNNAVQTWAPVVESAKRLAEANQ